jgi:hypothetical protein
MGGSCPGWKVVIWAQYLCGCREYDIIRDGKDATRRRTRKRMACYAICHLWEIPANLAVRRYLLVLFSRDPLDYLPSLAIKTDLSKW